LVDHHGFTQLYLRSEANATNDDASTESVVDGMAGLMKGDGPDTSHPTRATKVRHFSTPEALLDFVTKHWRDRWVTTDIPSEDVLDMYSRRPFFLLISVDAPLTVRWRRYQARVAAAATATSQPISSSSSTTTTKITTPANTSTPPTPVTTLEAFAHLSDTHLYDPRQGIHPLISRASVRLLNTSSSLAHLYATLGTLDLLNPDRLRPSWDSYFMSLASLAAQRSNCMKRRVGAVVVRDRRVVSTGYNGTPRGLQNCGEGGCSRCNSGEGSGVALATCLCIHAEENALLEAGRERLTHGAVLYCDTCPCLTCSIKIVQVGIREVVYRYGYSMDGQTAKVFQEAGVKLRQFIPVSFSPF
jgi:dCMP deaminase